jgi:hypothetical protein
MVMIEDGSSLLEMKERMIDPSSAHGSCKSRCSVLSRLSLQSREHEYEEQQALSRSKHGASRNNSNHFVSEASTTMLTETVVTDGASVSSEQDCISQLMAESDIASESGGESVRSSANSNVNTKLSPLDIIVKKCSRELQAHPPVDERRAQLILQSLLNIVINRRMKTTSNAMLNATSKESSAENAKQVAIKYGALPAITCVMRTYRGSTKLQSRAILILGALGEDNAGHQEAIADYHGVSYVLAVLLHSSHSKSSSFCLEACSTLIKVMSLSHRSVSQLVNGDGVRTIRRVMQTHSKHAGIQQYCLAVLGFVAKLPSPQGPINHCRRGSITSIASTFSPYKFLPYLEDPEVIEVLVAIVAKHRKTKPILHLGGHLIFVLSTQGTCRTKNSLTWSNAVQMILKVMKSSFSNGTTQLEGALSFESLARERPEARGVLAEEGCAILLESLSCHPKRNDLQQALLGVLSLLCDQNHTAAHVAKCLNKNSKYKKLLLQMQSQTPGNDHLNNILQAAASA